MAERPISWREVLSERSQEIDDQIVNAYSRGASPQGAYDHLRSWVQAAAGAEQQIEDCGPGSAFDSECRKLFEDHVQRLERSGRLHKYAGGYTAEQPDMAGAWQVGAFAGGSAPRGAGHSREPGHPDQWGRSGQAVQPDQTGRAGIETEVPTGYDELRKRHEA